jgi:hypothetical protein
MSELEHQEVPVLTEVVDDAGAARRPALDERALEVLARELERAVLERLGPELDRVIEEMRAKLAVDARQMVREAVAASVARALARPERT